MTNTERNELVEKLKKFVAPVSYDAAIREIESLGYEIVKKEALKELQDAFALQQIRAGNFTYRELTDSERAALNSPDSHSS